MKKTTIGIVAVVVGFAMLTLAAVSARAQQRPGFEMYVVRSGDTLSKISGRVFGDPQRWREILQGNPQVTNANLIFPGDILMVPLPESAATAADPGGALAARAGADAGAADSEGTALAAAPDETSEQGAGGVVFDAAPGAGADDGAGELIFTEPPPAVVNPALYRSAGHIMDQLPAIAIVASPDGRLLLGTNDEAIVNASLEPGARLTLVRASRRVYHPVTGEYLGWLIRILGTAEVTCREKRTSTVVLRTANDAASVGDYLIPFDPNDVLEHNALAGKAQPECIPAGLRDGVIVAFNEERNAVGEHDLAFIDLGTAAGVGPGRRFTIYREIAPEGRVTVGELQVLRAGVNTSTALITTSVKEVQVGNLLRAR